MRARDLEKWFVGHTVEIGTASGTNPSQLRADTLGYGADLERRSRLCFTEWLDKLGSVKRQEQRSRLAAKTHQPPGKAARRKRAQIVGPFADPYIMYR